MNAWYITMQFPSPSETFACTDVHKLNELGVNVNVHSMRKAHRNNSKFIKERYLEDLKITHNNIISSSKGLFFGLVRPFLLLKLLFLVIKHNANKPTHVIKSLLLVPRTLDIFSMIEKDKPDVLHLFWGHYPSMVGYIVRDKIPKVVLSIFLGAYDLKSNYGLSVPTAQVADIVWTHAKVNVKKINYMGVPIEKIQVIYRGVDIEKIIKENDLVKDDKKIVSVGRLIESKGMDDVLFSFSNIIIYYPDASLTIIGDGPVKKRLIRLSESLGIKHAVKFLGHVSHDAVLEEMAKSEIFLFMSRKDSERLPNVVKEAMAKKCFCIVTHTPGIEELMQNGKHGVIIPQGDINAAVNSLRFAFSNKDKVSNMTNSANKHIKSLFDAKKQMLKYLQAWEKMIQKNKQLEDE